MAATTEATPLVATSQEADEEAAEVSNNNKMAPKPPPPQHAWTTVVLASSIMGALFGLAFYKSHVYEPQVIRGQFLFQRFVMLKVFFGAMGIGALIFSTMSYMKVKAMADVRELWKPTSLTRGWVTGPVIGGVLLGVGMAVSGACPGMVWTALGAGTANSAWTIVGGLLGALVYGIFADGIQRNVLNRGPLGPCEKVYADEALGKPSPASLTLALGLVCLGGCAALETLVPWKSEVPARFDDVIDGAACSFGTSDFSFWECPAWPPSIAGMLLGSLQLPGVLLIGNVLGSATAFQIGSCIWLLPLPSDLRSKLSTGYMNAFATPNPLAWWQLPYVGVATLAASICAKTVNDVGGASGVDAAAAFVGGFILIFGSRLGGGCTSGHGLSGCALLMIQSWIAVPAMFAGGIALGVAWQVASNGGFFTLDA
ncbi:hypothetical protein ACHAXT_001814 [Thalassiosira profunda]